MARKRADRNGKVCAKGFCVVELSLAGGYPVNNNSFDCIAVDAAAGDWMNVACDMALPFFCMMDCQASDNVTVTTVKPTTEATTANAPAAAVDLSEQTLTKSRKSSLVAGQLCWNCSLAQKSFSVGGSCYHLSSDFSPTANSLTWTDALTYCQSRKSRLASINSIEEAQGIAGW